MLLPADAHESLSLALSRVFAILHQHTGLSQLAEHRYGSWEHLAGGQASTYGRSGLHSERPNKGCAFFMTGSTCQRL